MTTSTGLSKDDYLDQLQRELTVLADVLEHTELTTPVPSCPDWTLSDLGFHAISVLRFWRHVLSVRPDEPSDPNRDDVPDAQLAATLRDECTAIVSELRDAPLDAPMWSWTEQHQVSFLPRRMALEFAVHTWDTQLAAGQPHPIEPDLAWDGIDEYVMLARASDPQPGGEVIAITASDLGQTWVVRTVDGVMRVVDPREASVSPDASMEGSASDLLLVVWRRIPADNVRVTGDEQLLQRWLARADLS